MGDSAAVVIKVDPDDLRRRLATQGVGLSEPGAAAQPLLIAEGLLKAAHRRPSCDAISPAELGGMRPSRRARHVTPPAWQVGDLVSYIFMHDGCEAPFTGKIKQIHTEFRSCDVEFSDGTWRVEMNKLLRL